jgi:hypothetical protein
MIPIFAAFVASMHSTRTRRSTSVKLLELKEKLELSFNQTYNVCQTLHICVYAYILCVPKFLSEWEMGKDRGVVETVHFTSLHFDSFCKPESRCLDEEANPCPAPLAASLKESLPITHSTMYQGHINQPSSNVCNHGRHR